MIALALLAVWAVSSWRSLAPRASIRPSWVFGLLLSIALMGLAASWIAGLLIVLYVALHMMWEGHRSVVVGLHWTPGYNAVAPELIELR